MKICITSIGNSLQSRLDHRFGRCSYFVIYDIETGSVEFLPNPYKDSDETAGDMSVKLMSAKKVSKIVSGEFGIKVKPLLDSMKIQMIMLKNKEITIQEIINLLNH